MTHAAPGRLLELAVADLALLERVRLHVAEGLTVITGETGAGKSLLIDALGLALGARADAGLVRHGAQTARVEALFDRIPEPFIVVRELAASGRSTARVDDETVTAGRLAELAAPLVELHGQHEQQRLLDTRRQRALLDAFADAGLLAADVRTAVAAWRANEAALAELAADPRELARRVALLEHEAAEIVGAKVRPGEAASIEARLAAARHGEAISHWSDLLVGRLVGDDLGGDDGEGPAAVRDGVGEAEHAARELARLDTRFASLADRLAGLEAEVSDVADEARQLAETVDHDPAELARLEERLGLIYALERRYGDDEAAVVAHGERAASEAARLRDLEAGREAREAERARLLAVVAEAGSRLSAARTAAASRVGPEVEAVLAAIGMTKARFAVIVSRRSPGSGDASVEVDGEAVAFDETGIDEVTFVLAPNPGEPARPLARIASGGELSRVALALEQVLAAGDATPTLVFDEIDAGIGGRSAEPVARALWRLGRGRAVLCVTHLPQIAAYADAHVRIAKVERDGRTTTELHQLEAETRVVEVALMIGGHGGGPAAAASAREMLERAGAWRASEG